MNITTATTLLALLLLFLNPAVRAEVPGQPISEQPHAPESAIDARVDYERSTAMNPFAITPHKPNYMLPYSYNFSPNSAPFEIEEETLDHEEMKFQLSFKVMVLRNILKEELHLFFGYTNQSYWQAFNSDISSPFRETNHEPELMLTYFKPLTLWRSKLKATTLGFSHQSNGQVFPQSRSWNRVYLSFLFENHGWYYQFKPWYRLREGDRSNIDDPSGDDNPDIEKYMGHFEFRGLTYAGNHTFGLMFRNNLRSDNRGALQFDWTFPLTHRLRGYLQLFNGYGESLIDYDHSVTRVGFGFMLTNWL